MKYQKITYVNHEYLSIGKGYYEYHIYVEEYDSGWVTVDLSNSTSFNHYSNSWLLQYRRIGNIVHLRGAVTPKKKLTGLGYDIEESTPLVTTLPSECWPNQTESAVCQGSSMNRHLVQITTEGKLYAGLRYGTTTITNTLEPGSSGLWLTCNMTYFVD